MEVFGPLEEGGRFFEYFGLDVGYLLSFDFNRKKEPGLVRVSVGDKDLWEETI